MVDDNCSRQQKEQDATDIVKFFGIALLVTAVLFMGLMLGTTLTLAQVATAWPVVAFFLIVLLIAVAYRSGLRYR